MKFRRVLICTVLCLVIGQSHLYADQKTYRLALFAPRMDDAFWPLVKNFFQAACHDLNMACQVYNAQNNRFKMREQVQKAIRDEQKVDAILFMNFKFLGVELIQLAEEAHVGAFLLNAGLDSEGYEKVGIPQNQYRYWLGEMLPDDEQAGFNLANALLDHAAKKDASRNQEGKIVMIGLNGPTAEMAAVAREKGLQKAIRNRGDAKLLQVVPVNNWNSKLAQHAFLGMLSRYEGQQPGVLWAASDNMALAAFEGTKPIQRKGKSVRIFGGINWSPEALKSVESGEMTTTIGGHFMEAGWVAVLLYDYWHGKNFAQDIGVQIRSKMSSLNQGNIQAYIQLFGDGNWEAVDFTKFSKVLNPDLRNYSFDLQTIFSQFMP
nr:ABC transporter substrate-binding protein [uncultured Desulfobacter sp.]